MKSMLILNCKVVNEGRIFNSDILIRGDRIERIDKNLDKPRADRVIDAQGRYLLPGIIDDQVHFREPGLEHKGDIYSESRAAVAGGVTSYMEMPNTKPPTLSQEELRLKYEKAATKSLANYSFYMGASNDNLEEVLKTDPRNVCGIKVFMGSSTGNILVDNEKTLEQIFRHAPMLIAAHCEDENIIRQNMENYRLQYGNGVPVEFHPKIRSEEACYKSSSFAVSLAKAYGTKLHILHISTARETALFDNLAPLKDKKITAEACVHHLWFDESAYRSKGAFIKWNPAIKTKNDREKLFEAVLDDHIDVIATDHAPHLPGEKKNSYFDAPSGGPLVQHSLNAMLEFYLDGMIALEKIVEKMCHNPAVLFQVKDRGFVREGYYADLVLVDLGKSWEVGKENILYKCGWSPFEGVSFRSRVSHTWVSGNLVYENGTFNEAIKGMRLVFDR